MDSTVEKWPLAGKVDPEEVPKPPGFSPVTLQVASLAKP
jgi:hypothetical protein